MGQTPPGFTLSLQQLECRDLPSSVIVNESFETISNKELHDDWIVRSDQSNGRFLVSGLTAATGERSLASTGSLATSAVAIHRQPVPGDVTVSLKISGDGPAPIDVIAHASQDGKSYLAARLNPSQGRLELMNVQGSVIDILATVKLQRPVYDAWYDVTLSLNGQETTVSVTRNDTNQFLDANGVWQAGATSAITHMTPTDATSGYVGIGRGLGGYGMAFVDDFYVEQPATASNPYSENFDRSTALPAHLKTWSNDNTQAFAISTKQSLSPTNAIAVSGGSRTAARAWYDAVQPKDVQASVALRVDTLLPTGLIVRGQNLDTTSPSYYALTITRGTLLTINRVVDGQSTTLGTIRSNGYFSQEWARVTLTIEGDSLQAKLFRQDTQQWLGSDGNWHTVEQTALRVTDNALSQPGYVGLNRDARYAGSVVFDDFEILPLAETTLPLPATPPPSLPQGDGVRHYEHIRIAQLAYASTPFGEYEDARIIDSVDLVIPNPRFMQRIDDIAPDTPQLIYTNVSNLYQGLLLDWLNYADSHGQSRETAFYHVTEATPFSGGSPSSQPVNWFWNVARTEGTTTTDFTSAAHLGERSTVPLGGSDSHLTIGYPDRFSELNVVLTKPATLGWSAVLEYPAQVGGSVIWKRLPILGDTTFGFTQDGQVSFDPPADWVASIVPETGERLYTLSIRTLTGTVVDAPIAASILGRDFVQANGTQKGIIPAFDAAADQDSDGYLNATEYANRRSGSDARFAYEGRLFYPFYGQMRYVTNPSSSLVAEWAADYHQRFLQDNPLADGLFIDNSNGKVPFRDLAVAESTTNYTNDSAALVQAIRNAIAPKLVVTNTVGSRAEGVPIAEASSGVLEEFLLRPTTVTWSGVNDVAELVNGRLSASSPSPFVILDSHPGSLAVNDPRVQMGTLAYYYLFNDPESTYLMFHGGFSPSASWEQTWIPAVSTDIGQPVAEMDLFAAGLDPQNNDLIYNVFGRHYSNAFTLFKPLSYTLGKGTGTLDDATATTHQLNGTYRNLNPDGTLGPTVTQVTLRNGEGAVLIRA